MTYEAIVFYVLVAAVAWAYFTLPKKGEKNDTRRG